VRSGKKHDAVAHPLHEIAIQIEGETEILNR